MPLQSNALLTGLLLANFWLQQDQCHLLWLCWKDPLAVTCPSAFFFSQSPWPFWRLLAACLPAPYLPSAGHIPSPSAMLSSSQGRTFFCSIQRFLLTQMAADKTRLWDEIMHLM